VGVVEGLGLWEIPDFRFELIEIKRFGSGLEEDGNDLFEVP